MAYIAAEFAHIQLYTGLDRGRLEGFLRGLDYSSCDSLQPEEARYECIWRILEHPALSKLWA